MSAFNPRQEVSVSMTSPEAADAYASLSGETMQQTQIKEMAQMRQKLSITTVIGLFQNGLAAWRLPLQDQMTLAISRSLLEDIFRIPSLPKKPYEGPPIVGDLIRWFQEKTNPSSVRDGLKTYDTVVNKVKQTSRQQAMNQALVWERVVYGQAAHLHGYIQQQLAAIIAQVSCDDPVFAVERARMISRQIADSNRADNSF